MDGDGLIFWHFSSVKTLDIEIYDLSTPLIRPSLVLYNEKSRSIKLAREHYTHACYHSNYKINRNGSLAVYG